MKQGNGRFCSSREMRCVVWAFQTDESPTDLRTQHSWLAGCEGERKLLLGLCGIFARTQRPSLFGLLKFFLMLLLLHSLPSSRSLVKAATAGPSSFTNLHFGYWGGMKKSGSGRLRKLPSRRGGS